MDKFNASKDAKKINKKVRKSQHIVEKQTGIRCTTCVTKNIAICNAGLVNGLSEEVVYEHFSTYGPLDQIIMLPGKSCSFVSFKTPESAALAYENINGKLNLAQNNKPLYLSFAETLPVTSSTSNFENKPPGLFVISDFISQHEENMLLNIANLGETENSSSLKHRQVKHYGYEFRYDINNIDKDNPLADAIPIECNFLWERLHQNITLNIRQPDQLTINCYKPGQGIPPHIDTHSAFEGPLLSLSLGSPVVMDFRHNDGRHFTVLLPQRSLTIMSDEARYSWSHGITPRKFDIVPTENGLTVLERATRVSFTFRKVLRSECLCQYINHCDSQLKTNEIKSDIAAELEKIHVHSVYENIADHFSGTRHTPWPNVLGFVQSLDGGSILVDVGCGNGKYLGHNTAIVKFGCDSSTSLLNVCEGRGFEVFACNCLNIPLKTGIADAVISIAVIHHLANSERRLQAIKEILRVLRVDGKALILVWAKDQMKNQQKSNYLMQDRKNRKTDLSTETCKTEKVLLKDDISLPVHTNRTQFQHQDVLVPWKLKNDSKTNDHSFQRFLRFYHVFKEGELENLCKHLDNIEIVQSYYYQGNWCIMLKKTKINVD